jgi:hypothetical protein
VTTKLDCRVKDQFEIPGRDGEQTISGKKACEVINLREVR